MPSRSSPPAVGRRLRLPEYADAATRALFRAFVRDGRLVTLPAKSFRRVQLLDHVAQLFEPGLRYPEPLVTKILLAVYDDHATLRRALVDHGFLSRAQGVYWRSGGTVDL